MQLQYELKLCECMASNLWTMNNFISMSYANGYVKFDHCSTLGYTLLHHYLWGWLLTSSPEVWIEKLCVLVTNNTKYIGYDYKTNQF
jgi:hypothetical protein